MKKTILFFTLCLSLSAGACASAKTPVSQSTILAEDLSDSQEDDILIGSPNPFTVCATMEEAKSLIGFSLTFPDVFSEYPEETIQVLRDDKMLEVMMVNDTNQICIRKAEGCGDISGVYTEYDGTCTITIADQAVSLKGDDTIHLALWESGDYTYSLYSTEGLSFFSVVDLISKIR